MFSTWGIGLVPGTGAVKNFRKCGFQKHGAELGTVFGEIAQSSFYPENEWKLVYRNDCAWDRSREKFSEMEFSETRCRARYRVLGNCAIQFLL